MRRIFGMPGRHTGRPAFVPHDRRRGHYLPEANRSSKNAGFPADVDRGTTVPAINLLDTFAEVLRDVRSSGFRVP